MGKYEIVLNDDKENEEKLLSLANHILEECEKQGLTISDVEFLLLYLQNVFEDARGACNFEIKGIHQQ